MPRRVLTALLTLLAASLFALAGCAPEGPNGDGCRVRCVSDGPGLPPNRIQCLGEDGLVCAPVMGCLDSTPITVLNICTSDGPRCNDGSEPRCAPTTLPDGGP